MTLSDVPDLTVNEDEVPNEETEQRWASMELLACAIVQLLLVTIAYRIDRQRSAPIISTSSWAIFLGIGMGALMALTSKQRVHSIGLDPQVLFLGLLPPIILEAGFNTQRKGFFSNFWIIAGLAIVGTLIATFATGLLLIYLGDLGLIFRLTSAEAFLYGSFISAVDPVATLLVFKKAEAPPLLFNLVFGESVLNDAVAILIFTLFQSFVMSGNEDMTVQTSISMIAQVIGIFIGSVALAGVICYSSAYLLKHSDKALKDHPTYEISIVLLSSYSSYVAADATGLSGLLSVFFSGVFIRHYHMYNISQASAFAFKHLLSTMAFLAENFIYLYLGISVIAYRNQFYYDWSFILANIGILLVARLFNTFPLCTLSNCFRSSKQRIPFKYMIVIWFSGLRGAIAFALCLNVHTADPKHAAIMKSSTLFTVLFTTLVFGAGTGPLLDVMGLSGSDQSTPKRRTSQYSFLMGGVPTGDEVSSVSEADIPGPTRDVHDLWVGVDEKYLKPIFGGNPRAPPGHHTSSSNAPGSTYGTTNSVGSMT